MKRIIAVMLIICSIVLLFSCSKEEKDPVITTLEPIDTSVTLDEKVVSTLETDLFAVNIYSSYCEIAAYLGKEDVKEAVIPDSFLGVPVKKIGEYAFWGCKGLEKLTLPSSLIKIDRFAFEECTDLKEVVANEGLEIIGQSAFRNSALETITLPSTLIIIGKQAFYRTKISSVVIPDGVTSIPSYSFYGCSELKSVTFGVRVNQIDESAFYNCTSLTKIVIPEVVSRIGDYAFRGCTSLQKVFIHKPTYIGENSFYGCTKMTIYTPKNAKCISGAKTYGYTYVICNTAEEMIGEQ